MIRVLFTAFLFLTLSCGEEPPVSAIEKFLEGRYGLFAEVEEVRVLTTVKIDENTYFAQVKYGLRFKRNLWEIEKEIRERLKLADLYKNPTPFVSAVVLNELIRRCGRAYIERGRTCYMTESLKLTKIRGEWVVRGF